MNLPFSRRRFLQLVPALLVAVPAALRALGKADFPTGGVQRQDPLLTIELFAGDSTLLERGVERRLEDGSSEEVSYWVHPTHPQMAEKRERRSQNFIIREPGIYTFRAEASPRP